MAATGSHGTGRLTHVDESGAARMVDVSAKPVTAREATAAGRVLVSSEVIALLRGEGVPKGDALTVARLAGLMGAKQTPSLIPLCHPLSHSGVELALTVTIGRASCRERGCQYVYIPVVADTLKKKINTQP